MKRFQNWLNARFGRRRATDPEGPPDVDPSTGEILALPRSKGARQKAMPDDTIPGERGISIVAGERSLQTQVTGVLLVALAAILASGLLAWWYATQLTKSSKARESAQQALQARVGGESTVPPLGRVDPPMPQAPASATAPDATPPPLSPTSTSGTAAAAPPAKTQA
jgi:hypothetical protein